MKKGTGLVKINGSPLGLVTPELLRLKVYEPILILGWEKFANVSTVTATTATATRSHDCV